MSEFQNKAIKLKEETINSIFNKPVLSTMLERISVTENADEYVRSFPQPLQMGKGTYYIAENVSKPINANDILLGRIPETVPDENEELYIQKQMNNPDFRYWQKDDGHNTFAWDEILEFGLCGLKQKTENKVQEQKGYGAEQCVIDFLNGKAMIYGAYIKYISDYALSAEKEGMYAEAEICRNIASRPPETFREAMQLILFIGTFFSAYMTVTSALSYGRIDKYLLEFYRRDIENGILTKDDAECILLDFYCKNNLILGRGEHQMQLDDNKSTGWFRNPMFDSPQYIVLGGYNDVDSYRTKETGNNELTELFLDAFCPKFKNPVIVYRHSKPYNERCFDKVCSLLLENATVLNYNDETMIDAYRNIGVDESDALDYTIHACNWPDVPGKHFAITEIYSNLAEIIRDTMVESKDGFDSIDDFYYSIFEYYRNWFSDKIEKYRKYTDSFPNHSGYLRNIDCFMSGGCENIYPVSTGGIKYTTVYNQMRYVGSAIDALIAVDYLVYVEKKITFSEFVYALKNNFSGCEDFYVMLKHIPKYGDDTEISNFHAEKLIGGFVEIAESVSSELLKKGVICFNTVINDNNHRSIESPMLEATADGRKQGELLSENISPASRIENGSVTALFNSVCCLPFNHLAGGALNVKMSRSNFSSENGFRIFKSLMLTYLKKGGMQCYELIRK